MGPGEPLFWSHGVRGLQVLLGYVIRPDRVHLPVALVRADRPQLLPAPPKSPEIRRIEPPLRGASHCKGSVPRWPGSEQLPHRRGRGHSAACPAQRRIVSSSTLESGPCVSPMLPTGRGTRPPDPRPPAANRPGVLRPTRSRHPAAPTGTGCDRAQSAHSHRRPRSHV